MISSVRFLHSIIVSCLAMATATAAVKVEETVVATVQPGAAYVISPAGQRLATVTMKGSRHVILVDGVAGPLFDQKFQIDGKPFYDRGSGMNIAGQLPPIVFSDDGSRFAYSGRQSEEVVIVVDGKEAARLPNREHTGLFIGGPLRFSPGGKHFLYSYNDGKAMRVVVNGRAGPDLPSYGSEVLSLAFSPDDTRWAYIANSTARRDDTILVVDGKEPKYVASPVVYSQLAFLSDGKLAVVATNKDGAALWVDGKAVVRASAIPEVVVSPVGGRVAAFLVKPGQGPEPVLWLDGQEVAGTKGIVELVFSPDGKRYAALCGRPGAQHIVSDGRKHSEYRTILGNKNRGDSFGISFTADSSKLVYIGANGNSHFVVVEGEESDGFQSATPRVAMSEKGARVAYHGQAVTDTHQQRTIVADGRKYPAPNTLVYNSFTFSPDGSRHAWFVSRVSPNYVFVDGQEQGFNRASLVFSPNSQHVLVNGTQEKTSQHGLFLDGTLIHDGRKAGDLREYRAFTPDSRHLYWTASSLDRQAGGNRLNWMLYLDGQPVVTFARPHASLPFIPTAHFRGGDENFDRIPNAWQMASDGTLTFLEWTGETVKRFRVTPSSSTNVAALATGGAGVAPTSLPPAASTRAAAPVTPRPVATTVAPTTAASPAVVLTWNDLVRRPETRPAHFTVNREYRFQGGVIVRPGTTVNLVELKSAELVVETQDGKVTFSAKPEETDIVAVASAAWSQLTPAQRELTYPALLQRMDLWPYRLKLTVPFDLGSRKTRAGDGVLLLSAEGRELLVRIEGTDIAFNVEPSQTDLMARARAFLAQEQSVPGRVIEELSGKLVSPLTGQTVTLGADARPKYVVLYMGAGWCGPCQQFAPQLVKLLKDKKPAAGDFVSIYLSGDRNPAEAKAYATKLGIEWPTLYFKNRGLMPAFQSLFGDTIPQLVVTDRHGKVLVNSAKVGTARALQQLASLP